MTAAVVVVVVLMVGAVQEGPKMAVVGSISSDNLLIKQLNKVSKLLFVVRREPSLASTADLVEQGDPERFPTVTTPSRESLVTQASSVELLNYTSSRSCCSINTTLSC